MTEKLINRNERKELAQACVKHLLEDVREARKELLQILRITPDLSDDMMNEIAGSLVSLNLAISWLETPERFTRTVWEDEKSGCVQYLTETKWLKWYMSDGFDFASRWVRNMPYLASFGDETEIFNHIVSAFEQTLMSKEDA